MEKGKKLKPVKLEELKGRSCILKIGDKDYTLREATLDDIIWMNGLFGEDANAALKKGVSLEKMTRVCYRLLKEKKDFPAIDIPAGGYDDNGEEITETKRMSGPQNFRSHISGVSGIQDLTKAFLTCIGFENQIEDALNNMQEGIEKKMNAQE